MRRAAASLLATLSTAVLAAAAGAQAEPWFRRHQDADGRFPTAFAAHCTDATCTGAGDAACDVRVTSLYVLALLADGNTTRQGPHRTPLRSAVRWLRAQQRPDGTFSGAPLDATVLEDHALASWALCEAYVLSRSKPLHEPAQRALDWLERHADPQAPAFSLPLLGWRTLVHGAVDATALPDWPGDLPALARDRGRDEHLRMWLARRRADPSAAPVDVAAKILCRARLAPAADDAVAEQFAPLLAAIRHARGAAGDRVQATPPITFGDQPGALDLRTLLFTTHASYYAGGSVWQSWSRDLAPLVHAMTASGCAATSWAPPQDPWSRAGGRSGATATYTIVLTYWYRYSRLAH